MLLRTLHLACLKEYVIVWLKRESRIGRNFIFTVGFYHRKV